MFADETDCDEEEEYSPSYHGENCRYTEIIQTMKSPVMNAIIFCIVFRSGIGEKCNPQKNDLPFLFAAGHPFILPSS